MSRFNIIDRRIDQPALTELTDDEVDAVAGGVVPLLALTVASMALGFMIGSAWRKADR